MQRTMHRLTGTRDVVEAAATAAGVATTTAGVAGSGATEGKAVARAAPPTPSSVSPVKRTTVNTGGVGTLSYARRTRHGGGSAFK